MEYLWTERGLQQLMQLCQRNIDYNEEHRFRRAVDVFSFWHFVPFLRSQEACVVVFERILESTEASPLHFAFLERARELIRRNRRNIL